MPDVDGILLAAAAITFAAFQIGIAIGRGEEKRRCLLLLEDHRANPKMLERAIIRDEKPEPP